jgi:arsenate reductase
MAEAFLRKYANHKYEAHSAGLDPKGINPYTVRVMEEIGISLNNQYSKGVNQYLAKVNFQYFFTVCGHAEQNCPRTFLMSAGRHFHWDFEDPAAVEGTDEEKLAKFREVRDLIGQKVRGWLAEQGINA